MNCLSQNSPKKINCLKHPNKKILFVQINEIKENSDLLMCSNCFDDVGHFNKKNYIWLENILDINDNDIIDKWPLFHDDSLYKKIQSFTQKNKDVDFSQEILLFFDNLKQEVIQKIEDVKKQLITASQQLPNHQNHLIEEIKKVSQTNILKKIFTDSKQNYKQIEDRLRELILNFESQKINNTEIVNNLIKEYQKILQIYDLKTGELFYSTFNHLSGKVDQFFQKFNALSNNYDILQEMQMIKTNYQQSQQQLQIVKSLNNQILISQNINDYTNCVSDFILDENTKYVFRFQFINLSQTKKDVTIGLARDSQKDSSAGYNDAMSCHFLINQNQFYCGGNGIDKKEKGDFSVLRQDQKELEMRVCIKEGILQILDYPNYNHILSITDQIKIKLQEYKNLRLNISLYSKDFNVKLINTYKCLSFN